MPDLEPPAESMSKRHTPPGTPPPAPDRGERGIDDSTLPNPPGGSIGDLPTQKATPIDPPPRHPHDPARAGADGQVAGDAQQARKLGAALQRMEAARVGLCGLITPDGLAEASVDALLPTDEEAAARLVEYLAARDQMSDAMRAFGPPR
jgi:hypothetical protein